MYLHPNRLTAITGLGNFALTAASHQGLRQMDTDASRVKGTRPAPLMAELHLQNLQTWRNDPYAVRSFASDELDELSARLAAIASGAEPAAPVTLGLGELVLRAPA